MVSEFGFNVLLQWRVNVILQILGSMYYFILLYRVGGGGGRHNPLALLNSNTYDDQMSLIQSISTLLLQYYKQYSINKQTQTLANYTYVYKAHLVYSDTQ